VECGIWIWQRQTEKKKREVGRTQRMVEMHPNTKHQTPNSAMNSAAHLHVHRKKIDTLLDIAAR
jgi:hypothetical protein